MYDFQTRRALRAAMRAGLSLNSLSNATGISRATLREWRDRPEPDLTAMMRGACPRCSGSPLPPRDYAYLLGMYLGDGCISARHKGVYSLRITCDVTYPGIIEEVCRAVAAVKPGANVHLVGAPGCVHVTCFWKHWVCLFPQHGPGRKHERPIVLEDWQRQVVERHPGPFLRGLFHSDGCRFVNWTTRPVGGAVKRYEYPRYLFVNASEDILRLCTWALDLIGARWTRPKTRHISVARRESVALLDRHVGPKG